MEEANPTYTPLKDSTEGVPPMPTEAMMVIDHKYHGIEVEYHAYTFSLQSA